MRNGFMGGSSSASSANPISQLIRQFIDTSRSQQYVNELDDQNQMYGGGNSGAAAASSSSASSVMFSPDPAVINNLTPQEKHKISSRSHVMARQFYPGMCEGDNGENSVLLVGTDFCMEM